MGVRRALRDGDAHANVVQEGRERLAAFEVCISIDVLQLPRCSMLRERHSLCEHVDIPLCAQCCSSARIRRRDSSPTPRCEPAAAARSKHSG